MQSEHARVNRLDIGGRRRGGGGVGGCGEGDGRATTRLKPDRARVRELELLRWTRLTSAAASFSTERRSSSRVRRHLRRRYRRSHAVIPRTSWDWRVGAPNRMGAHGKARSMRLEERRRCEWRWRRRESDKAGARWVARAASQGSGSAHVVGLAGRGCKWSARAWDGSVYEVGGGATV